MVAGVKVGNFTASGGTGNQSVTGIGFRPAGVIIYSVSTSVADGDLQTTARMIIGAASSVSNMWGLDTLSEDAAAIADTRKTLQTDQIFSASSATTDAIDIEAQFVSFDADGFTINWTNATAVRIAYIAFATSVSCRAGFFDMAASLGNQTVTGVGFQPKVVLFMSTIDSTTEGVIAGAHLGIGAATSSTNRWAGSCVDADNVDPMDSTRYLTASKCIVKLDAGALQMEADFVSNNSDGFTIDVTNAPTAATRIAYFAIGGSGLSVNVGTLTEKATAGNQAYTGVGFLSNCLIFGMLAAVLNTIENDAFATFGAATSTSARAAIGIANTDAAATSDCARNFRDSKCISIPNGAGSAHLSSADLVTFDADGFTLNWVTTLGVLEYGYIALSVPDALAVIPKFMHEYRRRRTA